MSKFPLPDHEGYFWAKLKLADNPDDNSPDWEIVFAFDNILRPWCEADIETGECMMVSVPGLSGAQAIDAFVWGPAIPKPEELR